MESPDALQNLQLLNQDLPKTLERLQDTLVGSGLLRERQDTRGLLDSGLLPRERWQWPVFRCASFFPSS